MFFESRTETPPVSEAYAEAAELFAEGHARAARAAAERAGAWRRPGDVLLCADLERAAAFHRRYFATVILGARRFVARSGSSPPGASAPDEPTASLLAIERARVSMIRGRWQAAIADFEELLERAGDDTRPLLEALLASAWAQVGLADRAASHRERALDAVGDDARVFYELGYAEVCLRRWDEAALHGVKAVELAPRWARARVFLAESLLSRGRVGDAVRIVHRPLRRGLEDATLELHAGLQALHLGDHDRALRLLARYETSWGRPRRQESLASILPRLPWRFRDREKVLDDLAEVLPSLAEEIRGQPEGERRLIALPALRQEHQLCLPTAVALAAAPQNVTLDPRELFEAADGRDGTPVWRMIEVLRQRHWEVRCVRARIDVVRSLLDQGVVLIGQLEGLFENHVEVLCGEDEGLGLLLLRDPESWTPGLLDVEALEERYALSGGGLIAVLSAATLARLAFPPDARALEAEALIALEQACARGWIETAERAAAAIDDTSPAAVRRDLIGRGVVATPGAVGRRLLAVAKDPERHPLSRLRAVLTLERTELLDGVLASFDEDVLGAGGWRLVELARLRADGRWDEVEALCADLLRRYPQLDTLWIHRAEAAARSGRLDEARAHADHALELSPESLHVRVFVRQLLVEQRPAAERVEELRDLLARHPWHHALRRELAHSLAALGDGAGFETALRELQRTMPRLPAAWGDLVGWYLVQGRDDLARATLDEGRRWIGPDELPDWALPEKVPDGEAEDGDPETVAVDVGEVDAVEDELPQGVSEEEREILWQRARHEVLATDGGPSALEAPAFERLRALDRDGRLTWWESAHRRALEVHRALDALATSSAASGDSASAQRSTVREALPETLDGPPLSALHALLFACEPERMPRAAAAETLLWAEEWLEEQLEMAASSEPPQALELPPDLELSLARFQERTGDLLAAEARYRRLSDEHPGLAVASSQLGNMLAARGELIAAADAHRRALAVEPGLGASIEALIEIFRTLGEGPDELVMLAARCRLWPYSADALQALADSTFEQRGLDAALAEVAARAEAHRPETVTVLRAGLFLDAEELDRAARELGEDPSTQDLDAQTLDTVEPRRALACRVRLLRARERPQDALEHVEAALAAGADDDPWLRRLQGLILADLLSPEDHAARARASLLEGIVDPYAVYVWLRAATPPLAPRIVELLEKAPDEVLEPLAMTILMVLDELTDPADRLRVLLWCRERWPSHEGLREHQVRLLLAVGEDATAVREAEAFLALDPEAPDRQSLLAHCHQTLDPRRSLELLERAVARSGAVDDLAAIALAHHRLGDVETAVAAYGRVLRRQADNELALINLALLHRVDDDAWSGLMRLLERSESHHIRRLHAEVVDLARARSTTLPVSWETGARERLAVLAETPRKELSDEDVHERLYLGLALARWLDLRGTSDDARSVRRAAGTWWQRMNILGWPGTAWIPRDE